MYRIAFAIFLLLIPPACAQDTRGVTPKLRSEVTKPRTFKPGDPVDQQGKPVNKLLNRTAPFSVRVSVDKPSRTYKKGELMEVFVTSSEDGYLYLAYFDAANKSHWLFPNKYEPLRRIKAGQKIHVTKKVTLEVGAPFGVETLKAIVSKKKLSLQQVAKLGNGMFAPVNRAGLKGVVLGLRGPTWAEHDVEVKTYDPTAAPQRNREAVRKPQRHFLGVGIRRYPYGNFSTLKYATTDAKYTEQVFQKYCGVKPENSHLLLDSQATYAAIEQYICEVLPAKTKVGDTIFIFWSSHGGTLADVATEDEPADEKDGLDEYLVPFNGQKGKRGTLILDDVFGRWIQRLDGRRVILIVDCCHAAGQAARAKGISSFNFLDNEIARSKDVGQRETALLVAADSDEKAWESNKLKMSVMTYFLNRLITRSKGPLSLKALHRYLEVEVPAYIAQGLPGARQTPNLFNNLSGPFNVRDK